MHDRTRRDTFSVHRLGGEPAPKDLQILLGHAGELFERSGIELNWKTGWSPWLDTSYLTEVDWDNTDIRANVRASAKVYEYVAFIAAHEDGEYYGYWRGLSMQPIVEAPLVLLDNEEQFQICGSTFAESILSRTYGEEPFSEMRTWFHALGIIDLPETRADLKWPHVEPSPQELHNHFFFYYREQDASI